MQEGEIVTFNNQEKKKPNRKRKAGTGLSGAETKDKSGPYTKIMAMKIGQGTLPEGLQQKK